MFERYAEKARRVIFFTPYEASQSALLGLLREHRALMKRFLGETDFESQIRTEIERHITRRERISVSVDVPPTAECAKILGFAAEEADRLGHRRVGTGMLRMEGSLAAQILQGRGLKLAATREQLPKIMGAGIKTQRQTGPLVDSKGTVRRTAAVLAENAHFVDASGKVWNREEIWQALCSPIYSVRQENAAYVIEETIQDTNYVVVAVVLWKNAILASMDRARLHRMSIILVPEGEEWAIALLQVTPVKPT